MIKLNAKEPKIIRIGFITSKIVDGDGIYAIEENTKKEVEIRLLGLDAPEIKDCRKLRQDERETHLPAQLLIDLGLKSKYFLQNILPPQSKLTIISEKENEYDLFGRLLSYVYINSICINEELIKCGYAKSYDKFYCTELNNYRQLNFQAKQEKKGLYQFVERF